MKRLILMRHAKSSWASPDLDDHDRPLNDRGKRSAAAMGDWLRSENLVPDQALVSSSTRTHETFDGLGLTIEAQFLDALYHAGPAEMLEVLKAAKGDVVLMIGHNPGIAWFAAELVSTPPDHPRFDDYPTCATLVADFPINDWGDLKRGTGRVATFVVPREFTD